MVVTEVKPKYCKEETTSQQLHMEGHTTYSNCDQQHSTHGLRIYTANRLSEQVTEINVNVDFQENICITLKLVGNESLLLRCLYRVPPVAPINDNLSNLLREVTITKPNYMVAMGCFNLPEIEWDVMSTNRPQDHLSQLFIDTIKDLCLCQVSNKSLPLSEEHQRMQPEKCQEKSKHSAKKTLIQFKNH